MTRTFLEATAYHEAGHATAAILYGFKVNSLTVRRTADYAGMMDHDSPLRGIRLDVDGSDRAHRRAEKAIVIALAGSAAQRRFNPRSLRRHHAAQDRELAVDLALRIGGDGKVATALLTYLGLVADNLVSARWWQVQNIAAAVLAHPDRTLTADEVKAAGDPTVEVRRRQASRETLRVT